MNGISLVPKDRPVRALYLLLMAAVLGCQALPSPNAHAPVAPSQNTPQSQPAPLQVQPTAYVAPDDSGPELIPAPAVQPLPEKVREGGQIFSLEQLQGMAVAAHPAIAEAAARVDAMRGKWVQAGLPPNYVAGYVASEIGNDGTAGQQGIYLGKEFVTGDKLGLAQQVACWEIQRAEHQLRAMERRVLTDVQLAYFEVLVAQRRVELTEQLVEIGTQSRKSVEQNVKAEQQSKLDLIQSEVELETAHVQAENARATRTAAWRRLAALLGDPDLPISHVTGDPATNLPQLALDELVARVITEHPELAAAWADVQRARWQIDREVAQVVPNVDVQLMLQHDNSSNYDIVGIQTTMALPIVNRNQGAIQQAEAEASAAGAAARRLELSLRRQLATTYQRYEMANQQVKRYKENILPRTEETLRLTRLAFDKNELSVLQLIVVQRTYAQTHLAALESLSDLRAASTQLEGLLLQGSLSSE